MDVLTDIYESRDPEDNWEIEVPDDEVIARTGWAVYGNLITYFTCLRDSLRNIVLDIDKRISESEQIQSDTFWRDFILKAVKSKKLETERWDFKETLTMWKAAGAARDAGKVTFAEDVAGFANALGGVLVVGVKDHPREIVGIGSSAKVLENDLKNAREVISKHLDWEGELVRFHQVSVPVNRIDKLCLVIIVSQSCTPVGVDDGRGHYTFPIRRETGIGRVSRSAIDQAKANVNNHNFEFMAELSRFVLDN
jgi:hypothetical protein